MRRRWFRYSCSPLALLARLARRHQLFLHLVFAADRRAPARRARAHAAARLRAPGGAAPRPVALRAGPRRAAQRPRLRAAAADVARPGEFAGDRATRWRSRPRSGPLGGTIVRVTFPAVRRQRAARGRRRSASASSKSSARARPSAVRARRAAADRADDERRAREAPARAAGANSDARAAGGARDRGPELLLPSGHQPVPRARGGRVTNVFGSGRARSATAPSRSSSRGCSSWPTSSTPSCRAASAVRTCGTLRGRVMSLVLERRASKDEILELYLNDVYLGQRGSFAIHGVAEAARLFFGKDVANLSLSEAALIAGVIQSPAHARRSPIRSARSSGATWCCRRWPDEEFITDGRGRRAPAREPLQVVGARGRQRGAVLRRHGRRAGRAGVSRA